MRKCITLLVTLLLLLCSCSNNNNETKIKTVDMLNITDTDLTFIGCKNRLDSVINAMTAKISVLENAHNDVIKSENPSEYFFEKNYILTSFEPFIINSLEIANGFTAEMTNETAQTFYKLQSNGMDIVFRSDSKTDFELQFISESLIKRYTAEYDEKTDSFRYVFSVENDEEERVEEFLEFSKTSENTYVIQSRTTRCYIEFNEDDEIVYFCCGELNGEKFTLEESFFPNPSETVSEYWVLEKGKSLYSNVHTFENGVLTHEDCSGGPWKTVRINSEDYASAFYS